MIKPSRGFFPEGTRIEMVGLRTGRGPGRGPEPAAPNSADWLGKPLKLNCLLKVGCRQIDWVDLDFRFFGDSFCLPGPATSET